MSPWNGVSQKSCARNDSSAYWIIKNFFIHHCSFYLGVCLNLQGKQHDTIIAAYFVSHVLDLGNWRTVHNKKKKHVKLVFWYNIYCCWYFQTLHPLLEEGCPDDDDDDDEINFKKVNY